jgi:hypothetical protein
VRRSHSAERITAPWPRRWGPHVRGPRGGVVWWSVGGAGGSAVCYVEPAHRVVARALECLWEEALRQEQQDQEA